MIGIISHTYHNGLYVLQRWITQHSNLILLLLRVIHFIRNRISHIGISRTLRTIARHLCIRKHAQWEIKGVLLQPHFQSIFRTFVIVQSLWSEMQRNLILVIVILQVRTQTNETRQIFILYRLKVWHTFCVHEHLQSLVLTHIIGHILIHSTRIFWLQIIHFQHHGLFILCNQLCLSWVCLTGDTWRQNVVHWRTVWILLYIHRLHIQCAIRWIWVSNIELIIRHILIQSFGIVAPLAAHQVKRGKTDMRLLLEVSHEDTRKANRLEVADITHLLHSCAIALQWNLKLIPLHWHHLIITQLHVRFHDAGYMLLTYAHHILLTQWDTITVEALSIIQCVVIIDILYIGVQCSSRTIWLIILGLWRVTFRSVVAFIAQQDWGLSCIIIIATIIVIVITRRVTSWRELIFRPHFPHIAIHLSLQRLQILRIWVSTIIIEVHRVYLLFCCQSIQSHVLLLTCTCLIGKSHHRTGCTWRTAPYRTLHQCFIRLVQR